MTECPKCAAALKDDYGMVACSQCGSILFVDMEGVAHMGAEDASASEPDPGGFGEQEPYQQTYVTNPDVPTFDAPPPFEHNPMEEAAQDPPQEPMQSFAEPMEPPPFEEPAPEFSMDAFLGVGEPTAESGTEQAPDSEALSEEDPLGINEFANSEISQAKDGLFLFRLFIDGIDSKELREAIRESIEDSRFAWDPAAVMSSISKGRLKIDRLSPVKATILINRIKRLPVQIRWEQFAITQTEDL